MNSPSLERIFTVAVDGPDENLLMQISPVNAVVGVVEADVVVRRDLCHPALHVLIRYCGQRHELIVAPVMWLLRKRSVIELLQVPPEVTVELFQTEIVHLLHVVEEPLLQNTNGISHRTLLLGLLHLGGQDDGVVVLSPLGIVLVQFRRDPVPVGDDSLFAIVAYNQCRNAAEIAESVVINSDSLRLLRGNHAFCIDDLRIRKNGDEYYTLYDLAGETIQHLKGFPGKVHLHLLSDDGVEVKHFLVFFAPFCVILAELPVRVELQAAVPAGF